MRIIVTLLISLISLLTFSQSKGLKCIYASVYPIKKGFYEIENELVRKTILERAKSDRKIYSLTASNGVYLFKKEPESIDKMPLMVDRLNIYVNLNDSSKVTQSKYAEKLYVVKGKAAKLDWDIDGRAETILGRTCYKATLRQDSTVTAWFTTDVPMACGPLGYYGLPGLVVRMTTPVYTLDLESIAEADNVVLKEPEEGIAVTEEEYIEKVDKGYKKLLESADKVTVCE